jgi:type II secretory pathway pseudopilin PulG
VRPFRIRGAKRGKKAGSFLLDAMLSVLIIGMAAAAYFAMFPTFKRSQKLSEEESKAVMMAQRMIEHLQLLKPTDLTASTLSQLNLIDTNQTSPPYSFAHIPLDEASKYSPAQTLRNATATMEIDDLPANSKRVRIVMTWRSSSGKTHTLTSGTILGGHR